MDEDVAERVERRKKALSNSKSHLFLRVVLPLSHFICFQPFALYISACCVNSFDSTKAFLGTRSKSRASLAVAALFVVMALIVQLCLCCRCLSLECEAEAWIRTMC